MRAVKFDAYGGLDVLEVREVANPVAEPGGVVVRVKSAAINPGDIGIISGAARQRFAAKFPSAGVGASFAGIVDAVGDGVTAWTAGDEVFGWSTEKEALAELVSVPAEHLVTKPAGLSWEVASTLYGAPSAAWSAVEAVGAATGDTVVVSGAAGGAGGFASQYALTKGATVIGLASEYNHDWLRSRGIIPVQYGDGQLERIHDAAPSGIDAFVDTFGDGYIDLAVELGVGIDRINTITDFAGAARLGVQTKGSDSPADPRAPLTEIAAHINEGRIELPIAQTYPLEQVRDAYTELSKHHTRGKIVLLP
ncbi:NADP-dependent oxidoreductase [Streptomyces chartreusis]|uniref:NADP-dependent oxidoreductase n=2 Tax=Streptomyces chartreusis TaxID=1969 RepID=A0A7H8T1G0_STRCX|nr:NADP-dependent oxidoreductase [Streptomyces chartreusis]QKZ16902.1 NADP-dependent oxidoreductase [Streptomyces chartreusis]QKZ24556.1 NADP-dependent oxidoreductase [Streptomyces chartreusis]